MKHANCTVHYLSRRCSGSGRQRSRIAGGGSARVPRSYFRVECGVGVVDKGCKVGRQGQLDDCDGQKRRQEQNEREKKGCI